MTTTETAPAADPNIDAVVAAAYPESVQPDLQAVADLADDELDQIAAQAEPETDPDALLSVFVDNGGQRDFLLRDVVAITEGREIANPAYTKTKSGPKTIRGAVIHVRRNAGPKAADGTQPSKINPVQLSEPVEKVRDKAAKAGRADIPSKVPTGSRTSGKRGGSGQPPKNMGTSNEEVEAFVAKSVKADPDVTVPALISAAAASGISVSRNRLAKIAVAAGVKLGQRTKMGTSNEAAAKVIAEAFAGGAQVTVGDLQRFVANKGLSVSRNRLVGLAQKGGFTFAKAERKAPTVKTEDAPKAEQAPEPKPAKATKAPAVKTTKAPAAKATATKTTTTKKPAAKKPAASKG